MINNSTMPNNYAYSEVIRSVYLGHCIGCLEMLRTTSDDLLRFMGSDDFSALIILSAVAGLESYLRDRLGRCLFSSGSREVDHYIYEYQHSYNDYHYKKDRLEMVPEGGILTDEQKEALGKSVQTLNYHQTNKLNDRYFNNIFKVSIVVDGLSERIDEIIELRNFLSHNGGIISKIKIHKEVDISRASAVIDTISDYIKVVETRFLGAGYVPVVDEFELSTLGIESIDLIEKKNQER